jgi:hypothetical protein
MALYDKPVRLLFHDMVQDLGLAKGEVLTRRQGIAWFREHYPKVKESTVSAHFLMLSTNATSRVHHNVKPGDDDLLYQIDGSRFRLYEPGKDPLPIRRKQDVPQEEEREEPEEANEAAEFAYERDLQNFLAGNLHLIEPGLRLYEEEGITGIEFPVGGRFIDILAVDSQENYVVVELKVSRGYDRVVGQLLRYMAWINKHQVDEGQRVRGIIVAREISEDLLLACSQIPNVALYEYELSVSLKQIE